jgi:hypothetical protein
MVFTVYMGNNLESLFCWRYLIKEQDKSPQIKDPLGQKPPDMQYTSYLGQKPHGQKSPRHKPQDKSHLDKKNLGQKPPDKKKPNNE